MEDCPICTEPLVDDVVVSYCDHPFHKKCLLNWMQILRQKGQTPTCPLCRTNMLVSVRVEPLKETRCLLLDMTIQYRNQHNYVEELEYKLATVSSCVSDFKNRHRIIKEENERLKRENEMLRHRMLEGKSESECKISGYSSDVPLEYQIIPNLCNGFVHGKQCVNKAKFGLYCGRHERMYEIYAGKYIPTVMKSNSTGEYHVLFIDQLSGEYKYHCDLLSK